MLVLTRKPEEQIIIGNEELGNEKIVITVLKVQGGKVSLGIKADKEWKIVRKELLPEEGEHQNTKKDQQESFSSSSCVAYASDEAMELAGAPLR